MKKILLILLCLPTVQSLCQHTQLPKYYVNAQEVDFENFYLKAGNIDSVRAAKTPDYAGGAVYITTKHPVTFLTLDTVLKNYSDVTDPKDVIYLVDNKLITDKSKVSIDASYHIEVEIKHLNTLTYLDKKHQNLILANIKLLDKKAESEFRIHGPIGRLEIGKSGSPEAKSVRGVK